MIGVGTEEVVPKAGYLPTCRSILFSIVLMSGPVVATASKEMRIEAFYAAALRIRAPHP